MRWYSLYPANADAVWTAARQQGIGKHCPKVEGQVSIHQVGNCRKLVVPVRHGGQVVKRLGDGVGRACTPIR